MPRAPGSSKRQQGAASHRDNRHENGLVGSAKRSSDKKGSGLLDNSLRRSEQGTAGAAGQSTPVNGHANSPYKQCVYDASNDSRTDDLRRSSLDAVSEMSSDSSNANGLSGVEAGHRQIDVNAMKNADVHRDSGPFDLATTVLKSLPMQDTLAILIILMHVPSLSLTVIYTIFTFLTFVPPVATSSGMSINLAEIFDGNSTMPSLVTVLCVDFFFLLVWLFLWGPIQDAILDFAKPVIAITLGGGRVRGMEHREA
ncbi:putative ubiquitination network signaling protein acrB [Fusarium oxysporum f. sp. raphani]|uniref:Putative ubiquitination network signaling protein acrB n=1 Tax=Fusarium oxysporum f. sp. raphani TaxID=96318 RepID=A0A8J5PPS5_FUSOX|nr:putative ubiquitination network signaling protein acrB [Fusarium oxysporum f. sp. raphani]